MITIKLQGGLGNQMFEYAVGKSLALKYNTQLVLDHSFLENKFPQKKYTLRFFELDIFGIEKNASHTTQIIEKFPFLNRFVHPFVWSLFHKGLFGKGYIKELNGAYREDIPDNSYLDGFWQAYPYFEAYKTQLQKIFTVQTPLSQANKTVLEIIETDYQNSVSVHIRRGDYVTNTSAASWHGICSYEYYQKALGEIQKYVSNPHFFVFSDDIEWVKKNMNFGEKVTFVDHNGNKGGEDLRIMYSCAHHIIANSSFSWWGAWLGRNENKTIISPKQWLATSNYDTSKLIPNTWIKI